MANRFFNPREQFASSSAVYAGGWLYFYASGTDTPLDTYSNAGLSIANTNPVELNSAGRPSVDIFLSDASYKVVLKDVDLNTIWTADPVYTSDFSGPAQFSVYAGNPNGNVAGTAGSGSVKADAIWDTTNNILYVATTTGDAATTVWTAVNASTAAAVVVNPQGRLTPVTATPIIASDSTAATAIYYTPYIGNIVPIYNGSSYTQFTFSELTLSLVSSHSANSIYDVFVFSNSGVVTLATGPSWGTATAGSGARGTGAGTTQLSRINGLYVNAVQITGRNGSTTYTIAANQATYLGTIFMDASNGEVTCHVSWGQSRKFGVWNAFNRRPIVLIGGDSTSNWTYATATIRAANGDSANKITTLAGLPEEAIFAQLNQAAQSSGAAGVTIGIGLNSTTVMSGTTAVSAVGLVNHLAQYTVAPGIGINNLQALENASSASSVTLFGAQGRMNLTAQYMG